MTVPSFSPYPFARLRRITRGEAALESAVARWVDAHPCGGDRLARLVGPTTIRIVGSAPSTTVDPHAARAEIHAHGVSIEAMASAQAIRTLAQRWLGGPDELAAPRPLTPIEHGVWCLVVAAALADLGSDAQVWPAFDHDLAAPVRAAALEPARTVEASGHARAPAGEPVAGSRAPGGETVAGHARARDASVAAARVPAGELVAGARVPANEPVAEVCVPADEPVAGACARAGTVAGSRAPAGEPVAGARAAAGEPVAKMRVPAGEPVAAAPAAGHASGRGFDHGGERATFGDARTNAEGGEVPAFGDAGAVELAVTLGEVVTTVVLRVPRALALRVPPRRPCPAWTFDLPVVVARAAVAAAALGQLGVGDIVTVERVLELAIGDGAVRLAAAPGAVEATIATGYVRRDMTLPDAAHLELTVQLGTTRLSLRQLSELAVGQVISLGRPLAGPFDVHAGGRRVGQGELIDIDGELGVRIVSLAQE